MKKILTILCAFAALLSCSKIQDTAQSPELRVNIRVTRSDDFAATKATVKSKWADGDMIYGRLATTFMGRPPFSFLTAAALQSG